MGAGFRLWVRELKDREFPTYPMIDPSSVPIYLILGVAFLLDFAFLFALGFTMPLTTLVLFWTWPFFVVVGILARRIGLNRIAAGLEGIGLLYGLGACLLLVVYGLGALSGPYADVTLARWDEALGFNWPTYALAMAPYYDVLVAAYLSFNWQPALIVIALVLARRTDRMWQLILAALIASAMVAVIFPFFPAQGVFRHYNLIPPGLENRATYKFTGSLDYLRGGGRLLEAKMLTGLVSFPSYHTVTAVLFAWAAWCVRWLRWPMVALNVAVLLSIPVIGAHYFIDVIAGAAIAIASVILAARLRPSNDRVSDASVQTVPA